MYNLGSVYCNYILIETNFFFYYIKNRLKNTGFVFVTRLKLNYNIIDVVHRYRYFLNERLHHGGFAITFFCACSSVVSRNICTPAPGDSNHKVRDFIAISYFNGTV